MRNTITAAALAALALLTAAPLATAQGDHGSAPPPAPTQRAERLLRAADAFDGKAAAMRARAGRLRATALELRHEAEDLAADASEPAPDDAARQRLGGDAPKPPTDDAEGTHETHDECAWDGEDDLGFSREGGEQAPNDEPVDDHGSEVCELLRLADHLEVRADALDDAAARMAGHAAKLREQAAKLLKSGGSTSSEELLRTAAKLRAAASRLRDQADTMRDTAFEGADVDDAVVAKVRRLELKAAAFDARADRLEARAAASVA